ncbi:hypothetical protein DFH07DRAFT_852575 [Mycena maculata]|uniref:Uncharacterized protein n=1 Tax=Mycena maculata TaxID=230809 RepID=A0AAD7HT98_9AGAR|nr:hypothetical protein DFH07DRAFT_852575 [Mycena maculata]
MLPDEIISEILSPALKVPDQLFCDTSHVSPFANYTPSTSAYLLVCKDWLRVATPLLYNVVVLRSKAQANALEAVLRDNKEFGRFIKKLRVEGGYGTAMHTILKSGPNITDIFLSLTIWSSDSTQGLCKGLPLINPHRVIVVDSTINKPLKNKNLSTLTIALLSCIRKWDNLRIFGFPYGSTFDPIVAGRALDLVRALSQSQTIHTVILVEAFFMFPAFIGLLCKIPCLRVLQFKKPMSELYHQEIILNINSDPKLKALASYTLVGSSTDEANSSSAMPDIAPSLNPSFIPMESASEETREVVWRRVLFFAMYLEELRSPSFFPPPTKLYPSRLPILLVSKYFNRLSLPYLYDSVNITCRGAASLAHQLLEQPHLGSFIRCIFISAGIPTDILLTIFSRATHVEFLLHKTHVGSISISAEVCELFARTTGPSLRELSIVLPPSFTMPTSVLATFTKLRILELSICLKSTSATLPENALGNLQTLHIRACHPSSFDALSMMRLESLQTLSLPFYTPPECVHALVIFFKAHGNRLTHLKFHSVPETNVLDFCKSLIDIELRGSLNYYQLTCGTPLNCLAKIVASRPPPEPESFNLDVFDMFPALLEIHLRDFKWPATERDISKSKLIPFAESLLEKNIKLTDSTGKHWIPRVKSTRSRKR